ncbi:hypothetical protein GCM10007989_29710 [Devosia pacifica]|uniref:Uncharacterized protein n=1 Tax=Devosia pacifica TaxID=1335967 RepID=A0A918SBU9_9HYPH|nr:hypothetical protein GCM10007989_29710 [Devosia pacifica]
MVKEDERPDHLPFAMRQGPSHGETIAEIANARDDYEFYRIGTLGIAEYRVAIWYPGHRNHPRNKTTAYTFG